MVAQCRDNRNTRKEAVQVTEDTFGDVHDVFVLRGRGVPPVGGTVPSPDDEVRFGLKLMHGLKGREDKRLRGVAGIFTRWASTRSRGPASRGPLFLTTAFMAPI